MQNRFTTASPCYMHGILPEEKYWSDGYSSRRGAYTYFAAKDDDNKNMMIIIPCRGDDIKYNKCDVGDTDNPAAGFPDPGTPLIVPMKPIGINSGTNVYRAQVSESCNVSSKSPKSPNSPKRKKKKTKRTKRKTKRTRRRKRRKTKRKAR